MRWLVLFFLPLVINAESSSSSTTTESPPEETTTEESSTTSEEPRHPGTYLIVAPAVIRPGLDYAVSVNILISPSEQNSIRLELRASDNITLATTTATGIRISEPKTVKLSHVSPALFLGEDSSYNIYVRGETSDGTLLFEDEKSIRFNEKSSSTFIQTDKGIYKPGETVKYRIIVVSPELLPLNGTVSIKIIDPNQNLIKQDESKQLVKGVLSGELELASEPPLGDWTIEMTPFGGQKLTRTFTVDQYVLPKFEVIVTPPSIVTIDDDITVLIEAKYTYGKGVAGKAKVIVRQQWSWNENANNTIEKTTMLNNLGQASVTFTNSELKSHSLVNEWGGDIKFDATVTEDLTDVERNGTVDVSIKRYRYAVDIQKQGDSFKPGLPYTVFITVKQVDDTPLPTNAPRGIQVSSTFNYPYDPKNTEQQVEKEEKNLTLSSDGTMTFTVIPPINSTSFNIEARYDITGNGNYTLDISYSVYVEAAKSPSNSYIQVIPNVEGVVQAGQEISFTVRTTNAVSQNYAVLTYQVLSRGSIVLSDEIPVDSSELTISFLTTSQMAPKSRLIVYTVYGNKHEILADAADFKVSGLFKNNVSLSLDKEEAEPGSPVAFTIQADPGSYVALAAVDQSVLLLKSGNDITPSLVEDDISQYDSTGISPGPWGGAITRRKRAVWFPWWGTGGQDAARVFENAGLVVLTDAYLYRTPTPILEEEELMDKVAKPSLAAMASNGISSSQPRLRTNFPESWIWLSLESRADGKVIFNTTAPDTITSWVASAFAVNEETGLGVVPGPMKFRVFRPFFIRLELPYSVKRGEKFALQVLVFNYMENEQEVTVTLKQEAGCGFDFMNKDGTIATTDSANLNTRIVTVPGGGASKAVYFPIVPNTLGDIPLQVTATSNSAGDAVKQPLKVMPEGYRVDRNVPIVMSLNGSSAFKREYSFIWPSEYVNGSRSAKVDIIGDIMGPILSSVDQLVRMPYGCGEQNMITFVPNIVVMDYLTATGRNDVQLEAKAKKYMESGYQRELTYKRSDNSFSAFGNSDKAGSTWLTAFVIRSFAESKPYIFIDQQVITDSIVFLNEQQTDSGTFVEHGEIIHKDMQGGASAGGVGLTAYVAIALLENNVTNNKALSYLESQLDSIGTDSYTLAVVTYALHLANSPKKGDALTALLALKTTSNDGLVHWSSSKGGVQSNNTDDYFFQPRPVDVETTAYALLSIMLEGKTDEGLPIVRWLTAQRNSLGGFSSTQDTVVGLQALAAYAKAAYSPSSDITVDIVNGNDSHKFTVNKANSIVLQSYELQNMDSSVIINATGKGTVFLQISYSYYRNTLKNDSAFYCTQNVKELRGGNRLQLDLCCNYTRPGQSNMVVAEIDTLSGYQYDEEDNQQLTSLPGIQRKEFQNDDTKINIYFNPIGADPVCFSLVSDVAFQVADQKPAQIHLFDYYNPEDQLKSTYTSSDQSSLGKSCIECWS